METYLPIPEGTGSCRYLFHEMPGMYIPILALPVNIFLKLGNIKSLNVLTGFRLSWISYGWRLNGGG